MRTWFRASRPFSFTASIVPVVVGTLLAAPGHFSWWVALLALMGSVLIHAGTNLVNDYYDHVKGADGPDSLGVGGAIQRGDLTPRQVLTGGIVAFVAGAAIGLILCATTSWELLYLGLASVLAGFLYTGAPVHLAYLGLGEATVFVFMGPVMVVGAYFVQTESWDWEPLVASLPIAFLVTAILQANNLRDIEHDRLHGKHTVATMVGKRWAQREMYALLALTYLSLVAATLAGAIPWPGLIALATLPLIRPIVDVVRTSTNPRKLNLALRDTARLHMRFGMVLALGLAINWAWLTLR
ncbi:MAG: 1,4-dihydroxy-2-naphthoate octaprenyltransferase [Dehalococcoidia bacterium]|nr:1,4-dihydroxy-2-naphthoate octaprenyltransferase [Dehalococcoidia bacterium]